jgi:hypothetical protein
MPHFPPPKQQQKNTLGIKMLSSEENTNPQKPAQPCPDNSCSNPHVPAPSYAPDLIHPNAIL